MKQLQTYEKQIGENRFYIRPFRAFDAASISAELVNLLSPILNILAPMVANSTNGDGEANFLDMDAEKFIDSAAPALSKISGEKLESIMRTLMIAHGNVSVEGPATDGSVVSLSEDLANELFCGELQDMFILCFEIVRINYKGFFKKLGDQFGGQMNNLQSPRVTTIANMASSI